ncbi:MAG TPA: hypothetical protein VFX49_17825 [Chloroflexota bacterium]|nr:hypothetical protein [Chloroflexota bacterium]
MTPKAGEVLVRMYGQGVGDCFLLAFPRAGARRAARKTAGTKTAAKSAAKTAARPVYVVIDCGVIGPTPKGAERMRTIVGDIRDSTGGRVDLLVLTHEHMDHVSGFLENQALDIWQNEIEVGAMWLAWTEKKDGGLPDALRSLKERQRLALAQVADTAVRYGLEDRHETTLSLMGFLAAGEVDAGGPGGPGFGFKFYKTVREAWNAAQKLAPEGGVTYCEPGDVRRVPGTDAVAYVLGPPRDSSFLSRLDPDERGDEAYPDRALAPSLERMAAGRSGFNTVAGALLAAALPLERRGQEQADRAKTLPRHDLGDELDAERELANEAAPFDRGFRVPPATAEAAATGAPETYRSFASYHDETNHWRRIDFDWLGSAESFAFQADNLTNNTSLVLAFELPAKAGARAGAERKVLLFTGDAQVGNILSWDTIDEWRPEAGTDPSQERPDIDELLQRVAFYKVGHHGSHNATLKERGVDRMGKKGKLTAFVPSSAIVARRIMGFCHMPLRPLMEALDDRTDGRVVFPNGNVWPLPKQAAEIARRRRTARVTISNVELPAVEKNVDGAMEEIEGTVPLWVQVAIGY